MRYFLSKNDYKLKTIKENVVAMDWESWFLGDDNLTKKGNGILNKPFSHFR